MAAIVPWGSNLLATLTPLELINLRGCADKFLMYAGLSVAIAFTRGW